MIYLLLLLTIYIWPFGQLLTFGVYPLDIAVFLVFLSLLISPQRQKIFAGSILKPLMFFLGAAVLSLLINFRQVTPLSIFYLVRLMIYPSLFFAARYIGFKRLRGSFLVSIVIFCLIGLLQYLIFPDMRYLKYLGFDDHYFRLIGSFYDPNFTGAVLAGIALYFINKNKTISSLPFIGFLALTFSRASYLVFFVGLIYLLFTRKKTKLLLLLVLLGIIIYLIPKPSGEGVNLLRTFSIYSRLGSWQQGVSLFIQKPVFGWGYNTLRAVNGGRFQIDNSFIFLLATTGIVGFTSFGYLAYRLYKGLNSPDIKLLILSFLIHSLFNNTLFYIWIMSLFWLALGIGSRKTKVYKPV